MGETIYPEVSNIEACKVDLSEVDGKSRIDLEALANLFDDTKGAMDLLIKRLFRVSADSFLLFTGKEYEPICDVLDEQRVAREKRDSHGTPSDLFILEARLTEGEPSTPLFGRPPRPRNLDDIERTMK